MQNARINSRTFASRILQTDTEFYQQGIAGIPAEDSAIDATSSEVSLTRLYADSGKYTGKEVEVRCQVLQDQRLPYDLMLCYRSRIDDCAVEALPGQQSAEEAHRTVRTVLRLITLVPRAACFLLVLFPRGNLGYLTPRDTQVSHQPFLIEEESIDP